MTFVTSKNRLLNLARGWLHDVYLSRYLQLTSAERGQVEAWQAPVAAARLNEDIPAEREKLLRLVTTFTFIVTNSDHNGS